MQRNAIDLLGIPSPYFRLQQGGPVPDTEIEGAPCVSFTSYNYLALNGHPAVRAAATAALERHGLSATASRLVGGERPEQRALERRLAAFCGTEDAVAMVSGHATNVTALGTLLGPEDLVLVDALAHNSVFEGIRLSGAQRRVFAHGDYAGLEAILSSARAGYRRVLIAVEGLYSMDGDCPDLARLVALKRRYEAWLMVDEAHALGVLGPTGRGLAEAQGVDPSAVEIWMGTLSKSLGACGGYIAGSGALVELLRHTAPGFVFSVGLSPVLAAGALAALDLLEREPDRVARLAENGRFFRAAAQDAGLDTGRSEGHAITPVILGSSLRAVALSQRLLERGYSVCPIVHPAVPENQARLRFFITSEHTPAQLRGAAEATATALDGLDHALEARMAALPGRAGKEASTELQCDCNARQQ
ncbi:MAG: aminotransferase class I/II-fold pyridoxal phosphate-dependent enzyme [Pseudomonadota bacterium]